MGEEKETVPEAERTEDDERRESKDSGPHTRVRISRPFLDDENAFPIPAGPIL